MACGFDCLLMPLAHGAMGWSVCVPDHTHVSYSSINDNLNQRTKQKIIVTSDKIVKQRNIQGIGIYLSVFFSTWRNFRHAF